MSNLPRARSPGDGGARPPQSGRWTLSPSDRIRESHHRINNHLQLLASSLGVEARLNPDLVVRNALLTAQRRVLTVARLHEQLQIAPEDSTVEVSAFLARVCDDMRVAFGLEPFQLVLDCDVIHIDSELAVTLSLIVSELVTNAAKYAGMRAGTTIQVRLRRADGLWRLTVADDGPGIGAAGPGEGKGIGLGLIQLLVAKLKGSMGLDETNRGASISVAFP